MPGKIGVRLQFRCSCLCSVFCITKDQVGELTAWLNKSGDFAMIASAGQGRWRAVQPVTRTIGKRLCLWHTPDGPLPLLPADPRQKKGTVSDPWSGWAELRSRDRSHLPPEYQAGQLMPRPTRTSLSPSDSGVGGGAQSQRRRPNAEVRIRDNPIRHHPRIKFLRNREFISF